MAFLVLDESERDDFLVVGGFVVPTRSICKLESMWAGLKKSFGLPVGTPLKWHLAKEVARQLTAHNVNISALRHNVCTLLRDFADIAVLAIALQERRKGPFRPGKGGVRDFYMTGVAFAVQRFAKLVATDESYNEKPHVVLLDNIAWSRGRTSPLWDSKVMQRVVRLRWGLQERSIVPWMSGGHKALLESYSKWWLNGFPEVGLTTPLIHYGFVSSFFEAQGERTYLLQMADFVCGAVSELIHSVQSGKPSEIAVRCVKTLIPVFCRVNGFGDGVWGCGIVLYPENLFLWEKLRKVIEGC